MKESGLFGIVTSVFLLLAGCFAMLIFGLGLLFDTRDEKICCPTLISCYPCDNPPTPHYWPLFLALALLIAGGLLLGTSLRKRHDGAI